MTNAIYSNLWFLLKKKKENLTLLIQFPFLNCFFNVQQFNVGLLILTAVASDIKYRNQTLENKNENRIQ